jgi:ABC-type bacteriocin/lantibiotic exporter with double-glycine peptidase domain
MTIELPLYRQQKDETCALACLRMVLAAFGTNVEERVLQHDVHMEQGGTPIEELERLARQHGLVSQIERISVEELRSILAEGKLPVTYLDRAVFSLHRRQRARHQFRDAALHSVVPTRVSDAYVTFHDPRPPRITRRSIHVFRQAFRILGGLCLVCSKPM